SLVSVPIAFAPMRAQRRRIPMRRTSIHCSGNEKLPPPQRYFAAKSREKNSHASRVINLLARSSLTMSVLDPPVWEVRLALWLLLVAQIGVRNRYDRVEELRLLPRV